MKARSPRQSRRLHGAWIAAALVACGPSPESSDDGATGDGSSSAGGKTAVEAPAAELLDSSDFESTEFGALHGEVRVTGKVPDRFPIGARKLSECCAFEDVEHMSDILVVNAGRVQFAFVQIIGGHEDLPVPLASSEPVVMDQRGCIYTPHVLAAQKGRKLLVENSDPATHNVNVTAPRNNATRNVSMVQGQAPLEFELRRSEEMLLKCDIHPWMSARVHVSDHPWFAVTDEEGRFQIPDVPPGEYVVEVVHEQLGSVRGSVVVEAGKSTGFALTLASD